jgi:2-polyprenyl-3-methyl-5-hydroxy-6-metoxy-1,4-benzoquinol methylase
MLRRRLRRAVGHWIRRAGGCVGASLERLESWPVGGVDWNERAVTLRFDAGARGEPYFEGAVVDPDFSAWPVVREQLDALGRIPLQEAKLLDFGCGNGVYHSVLASHDHTRDWRYTGADVNTALVDSCRARWPLARFEVADGEGRLPFDDAEFDVVLASGILLCVRDTAGLLAEFNRVCSGWALVSRVPVRKFAATGMYLQRVRHRWGREAHPIHIFNRGDLLREFESARFAVDWWDHGVECYDIPGEVEPVHHMLFLLRRKPGTDST